MARKLHPAIKSISFSGAKTTVMTIRKGDSIGFRPTGTEITGVHYKGTPPTLWGGFVNGDRTETHVPVWCERLGGIEATTIMVALSNIETVNGEAFKP